MIKRQGNAGDIIGTSLCLLTILIVLITTVHFIKILECKRMINNQAREYLLILEEKGQLTTTEVGNLTSSINDMGFSNVTVTYNGTNTRVNYGQQVSISVVVNATWRELGLSKVYGFIKDNYVIAVKLYSTAKT